MKTILVLCIILLCFTVGCVQTADQASVEKEEHANPGQQPTTYTTDPKVVINVTTS